MTSLADRLPPDFARQLDPGWRKNEADYWAVRDQLLKQHEAEWIGFADGAVVASGNSPVAVFHAAEAAAKGPFVTCVGHEEEPCRMRRVAFSYDSSDVGRRVFHASGVGDLIEELRLARIRPKRRRGSDYGRVYLLTILLVLLPTATSAQDDDREVALPFVTLVQPPDVPKLEATQLPEDRVDEIERLIDDLSGIVERDLSINTSFYGSRFVPVGVFGTFGEWTGKHVEVSDPIRKLVEIGPEALPYLLGSLDDQTPTDIVIPAVETQGAIAGGMAFDEILHGNPANPTERFTLNLNRFPYSASIRPKNSLAVAPEMESYRIKIGDVCLIVIGQIVGREYECLTSPHVKSLGVLVCSPVHRKTIRNRIRKIWESKHPRQKLLESLVMDFSTRGLLQMDSLDYWDIGNDFQIESTKRLLYYYPDIAVPLIVKRINNLQVSDDFFDDCVRNGLRPDVFVDAIAWSTNGEIKAALSDLAPKAKENDLVHALQRAGVKVPDRK
jgi:hypothetical protein